jgi:hypothetical protein
VSDDIVGDDIVGDAIAGEGSTAESSAGKGSAGEGGDGAENRLERRARLLLRVYPPDYRANRGEEIVGTLLEATRAGRDWPSARDAASLIGGGIRARKDANQHQGLAASLRQAAGLGLAVYLVISVCGILTVPAVFDWFSSPIGRGQFLPLLPLTATVAAAWSGRRWLVAVPAAIAAAAIAYSNFGLAALMHVPGTSADQAVDLAMPPTMTDHVAYLTVPLLAMAALVLLTGHTERPPRSWLWLLCLPVALSAFAVVALQLRLASLDAVLNAPIGGTELRGYLSLITVVVAICWLVTDIRPLAGLALGLALTHFNGLVVNIAGNPENNDLRSVLQLNWPDLIEVAVLLAIIGALAWLFLRRTRVSAPAAG